MPNSNGTTPDNNGAGLPSVIEYVTQSGVVIHITPLSLFTIQAITQKAEEKFAYPDDEPFREASDLVASGFIPASENEAYQALCKAVDEQRAEWQNDAIIDLACAYPQWGSRREMIAHFQPKLEQLGTYAVMHADEWQNVLEHCVFTGFVDVLAGDQLQRTPERFRVLQLAKQNSRLALTMPEVIDGIRLFRLSVPGAAGGGLAGETRRVEKRD